MEGMGVLTIIEWAISHADDFITCMRPSSCKFINDLLYVYVLFGLTRICTIQFTLKRHVNLVERASVKNCFTENIVDLGIGGWIRSRLTRR